MKLVDGLRNLTRKIKSLPMLPDKQNKIALFNVFLCFRLPFLEGINCLKIKRSVKKSFNYKFSTNLRLSDAISVIKKQLQACRLDEVKIAFIAEKEVKAGVLCVQFYVYLFCVTNSFQVFSRYNLFELPFL